MGQQLIAHCLTCSRIGVYRSEACTLTMRVSICVRPRSTRPPPSWSGLPSPRPGPTSWAVRRRCSGQSSCVMSAVPCVGHIHHSRYICQGRDECSAGVCHQGCDPASLLHLLVSFMRTICPGYQRASLCCLNYTRLAANKIFCLL